MASSAALGCPTLVGATGSPAAERRVLGNTQPCDGVRPSQGAELGQDLAFSRHIHEPAWGRKGIQSQDTAPGAHHDLVLGPLGLQSKSHKPSPSCPPAVLWGKSQMLVWVLQKGPSTHPPLQGPGHSLSTQSQLGPQHPDPLAALLWPKPWYFLLAE